MMGRYRLLKGYALATGAGLFVLGLLGLAPLPLSPFPMLIPEGLLHLGAGSLFVGGALAVHGLDYLRGFVGGMGGLLVGGKVILVGARWSELGLHLPLVGAICLLAGVGSLLVAAFVSVGTPPED